MGASKGPRFKAAPSAEDEEAAAAKRAAYKAQCDLDVAAFQRSLALEDVGPSEDVSYLTGGSGGGSGSGGGGSGGVGAKVVLRRSADLEREAFERSNGF